MVPVKSPLRTAIRAIAFMVGVAGLPVWAQESLDQKGAYEASQAVLGRSVPEHILLGTDFKPVRLSGYRGKPLLVNFIYTGCFQACPTDTLQISKAVAAVQDLLGAGAVRVATIGFNVPFDSPEAMAAFATQRGISASSASSASHWDFLSPAQADVAALTRDFGFLFVATPKGFDHVTQLTVVDRDGRIYRQLYSDNLNAQAIVGALRDMDNGVVPVAQGWSGVLARIRVLCTVYDRSSGVYRPDYSLIVGMLVGASILGSVAWFLAREWRMQHGKARCSPCSKSFT